MIIDARSMRTAKQSYHICIVGAVGGIALAHEFMAQDVRFVFWRACLSRQTTQSLYWVRMSRSLYRWILRGPFSAVQPLLHVPSQ